MEIEDDGKVVASDILIALDTMEIESKVDSNTEIVLETIMSKETVEVGETTTQIEDENVLDKPKEMEIGKEEEKDEETVSEELIDSTPAPYYWDYDFKTPLKPHCIAQSNKQEFQDSGFLKGCKWAPDGSCLLTNSDDSTIRLFNFPANVNDVQDWNCVSEESVPKDESWSSSLKVKEGGPIYDFNWYPFASSADPASSCFLTTAKDAPVHLWDASYGDLRASYRAYNDVDEPISAYSVAFDPTGQNIYCGYEKSIRIFNTARPGRDCTLRKLTKSTLSDLRQHGFISCIAFNPLWSNVCALGSYRRTVGLYMEDGSIITLLDTHLGGVTHLAFSRDGTKLYSGARSDSQLICWDLRSLGSEYSIYNRVVKTQQRIYFELTTDDRYLISGSTDGVLRIWDTLEEFAEPQKFVASTDCINGVSINPYVSVIATSSGQRILYDVADDSDDEMFCTVKNKDQQAHDVQLWKF